LYNTNSSNAKINWYCIDQLTGSACFSRQYDYINVGSTDSVTINSNQLFFSMTYNFRVEITDTVTMSKDSSSCMMWASN
jgi:hypothetical protein